MNADYAVKITVRNGRILSRMRAKGIASQTELAALAGTTISRVNMIVAMRERPIKRSGEFRETVERIAGVLSCDPDDLFTDRQKHNALPTNTAEVFMDERQVMALTTEGPERGVWAKIEAERLLDGLKSDRARDIVRRRMEGEEQADIAADYGITSSRAHQIEHNAIRQMRGIASRTAKAHLG